MCNGAARLKVTRAIKGVGVHMAEHVTRTGARGSVKICACAYASAVCAELVLRTKRNVFESGMINWVPARDIHLTIA